MKFISDSIFGLDGHFILLGEQTKSTNLKPAPSLQANRSEMAIALFHPSDSFVFSRLLRLKISSTNRPGLDCSTNSGLGPPAHKVIIFPIRKSDGKSSPGEAYELRLRLFQFIQSNLFVDEVGTAAALREAVGHLHEALDDARCVFADGDSLGRTKVLKLLEGAQGTGSSFWECG